MDISVQEIEKEKEIYDNIDVLNKVLWDGKVLKPTILEWLDNFKNDEEKRVALYLLSRCMYFNQNNVKHMLKALFRDKYRTPILQEIRDHEHGTMDEALIEPAFHLHLMKTRFLGIGNPAESGNTLLYSFRQENKIKKDLFVTIDELLQKHDDVQHVVFIDDLCGSGTQVRYEKKLQECIRTLRLEGDCPKISYLMLFGTTTGIDKIRKLKIKDTDIKWFDEVEAEMELNDSYKCFGDVSRYFEDNDEKAKSKEMCLKYGTELIDKIADKDFPNRKLEGIEREKYIHSCALGYGNCQLLLSLYHNTPNNTLPIFWFEEDDDDWKPIFKRYNKVY